MGASEKTINTFATRVRQMILKFEDVKRENEELYRDYQGGLLSIEDYLKKRWPEMSEEEVKKKAAELEAKRKEESAFNFPVGAEGFGGFNEDNERPVKPTGGEFN